MKRKVLFFVFAFVFVFSVFSHNRSVVAEYRCEPEIGGTTGNLILYSDGSCDVISNGKNLGFPVYYQLTERQLKLWGKYNNGVIWENVWTLIPRFLNGQNYYESIWSHSFENYKYKADGYDMFAPLGGYILKDDRTRLIHGKMIRVSKNTTYEEAMKKIYKRLDEDLLSSITKKPPNNNNTTPSSSRRGPEVWSVSDDLELEYDEEATKKNNGTRHYSNWTDLFEWYEPNR